MKKLILFVSATFAVLALSNCEVNVQSASARGGGFYDTYSERIETIDGMTYKLWYVMDQSSQTGYAVHSVNLTKDSLECAHFRKMLSK